MSLESPEHSLELVFIEDVTQPCGEIQSLGATVAFQSHEELSRGVTGVPQRHHIRDGHEHVPAVAPERQVRHLQCGTRGIQVHHAHHTAGAVTQDIQHDGGKGGDPGTVSQHCDGRLALQVEIINAGYEEQGPARLGQFEPGQDTQNPDGREAVDRGVILRRRVRNTPEGCRIPEET